MSALLQQMRSDSPAVLFSMNDASGTIADLSGNGANGTVSGTVVYRDSYVAPGLLGLNLAASAYVGFTSGLNWGQGQAFTFSAWMRVPALGSAIAASFISKSASSSAYTGIYMNYSVGNCSQLNYATADEYLQPYASGAIVNPFADLKPHHIGISITTGNVETIMVDGAVVTVDYAVAPTYTHSQAATGTTAQRQNTGSERINQGGGYSSGQVVYGPIGLYQSALSTTRLAAHYQAGIRGAVVPSRGGYG